MAHLDTSTQLLIDEGQVALRVARTLVLDLLTIRCLQKEGREALDILTLDRIRILLGTDHSHLAALSADCDITLVHQLLELRLGRLTVWAPVGIIHCERILRRRGVGEALCTTEAADTALQEDIRQGGQYKHNNYADQDNLPVHLDILDELRSFYAPVTARAWARARFTRRFPFWQG